MKKKTKKIKKVSRKKVVRRAAKPMAAEKPVGKVTHFYGGIKVAVVKFSKKVSVGTPVCFEGATTNFSQKLASMQYNHEALKAAPKGKSVGVKVAKRVREGDCVYLAK
jgi:hypothetical protein